MPNPLAVRRMMPAPPADLDAAMPFLCELAHTAEQAWAAAGAGNGADARRLLAEGVRLAGIALGHMP